MRRVLAMQIEVVGSAVIRFKDGQVLLFQVVVPLVAGMESEKQREVGVVGIQDEQRTKIEGIVAGHGREVGIEQVVFLFVELCVVHTEGFIKIRACRVHFREGLVVNNDRQ